MMVPSPVARICARLRAKSWDYGMGMRSLLYCLWKFTLAIMLLPVAGSSLLFLVFGLTLIIFSACDSDLFYAALFTEDCLGTRF